MDGLLLLTATTTVGAALLFAQDGLKGFAGAERGGEGTIEGVILHAVQWLRLAVETLGALVIALGVVLATYQFITSFVRPRPDGFNPIRLTLARYLALALEFQLAADILSTAVAPSWEQIGKLGAIAVIRTGLNYFLMREMEHERSVGERRTREAAADGSE